MQFFMGFRWIKEIKSGTYFRMEERLFGRTFQTEIHIKNISLLRALWLA